MEIEFVRFKQQKLLTYFRKNIGSFKPVIFNLLLLFIAWDYSHKIYGIKKNVCIKHTNNQTKSKIFIVWL